MQAMPLPPARRRHSRRITLNGSALHLTPAVEAHLTTTGEGLQTFLNRLVCERADQLVDPDLPQD
jgi:hypothetical protein